MATKTRQLADFLQEGGVQDIAVQQNPHIQPGTLQPAVAGKLLNGATHSGAYGTAQTQSGGDGHKYYYTDIKGSGPIKDPRIGAHFGSQRYKFKSMQLSDTLTATQHKNVYIIDGREWCRLCADGAHTNLTNDEGNTGVIFLGSTSSTGDFFEITGYFNDFNLQQSLHGNRCDDLDIIVNGGTARNNTIIGGRISANKLNHGDRYVDQGATINHGDANVRSDLGTTPRINTIKIELKNSESENMLVFALELIAQDTGSATRKNHVSIPSQNVVSYGKKFTIGSDTFTNAVHKHYNPFAFKTDGTTAWAAAAHNGTSWPIGTGSSHNIDTATSLGLEKWKHGDNYYKPYNGGRVVKWVDSDGTIKTSVTVMPPNAKSYGDSSSLTNATAKTNASAANDTFYPTFEANTGDATAADEDGLSEVAKVFHWREFGNGAANTGGGGTFADASMLNTADGILYTLDDGLTTFYADQAQQDTDMLPSAANKFWYLTFIGTGVTRRAKQHAQVTQNIAQNLPYGSHILKGYRGSSGTNSNFNVDGITIADIADSAYAEIHELVVHQPKKPPIPDDACIISDYMLMAEHVGFPASTAVDKQDIVEKGVRRQSSSRDIKYTSAAALSLHQQSASVAWQVTVANTTAQADIVYFGNSITLMGGDPTTRFASGSNYSNITFSSGTKGTVVAVSAENGDQGAIRIPVTDAFPVLTTATASIAGASNSYGDKFDFTRADIASPTHTSSHYQTFETPYLHELVGGDRNMEQTNLVVTTDGKTWDELRDTSYLGPSTVLHCFADDVDTASAATYVINTIHRGGGMNRFKTTTKQKNLVWAYDRMICLVDGYYKIMMSVHKAASGGHDCYMYKNGSETEGARIYCHGAYYSIGRGSFYWELKRNDYIQVKWSANANWGPNFQHFYAEKIG